jgi:hypothetical protein
MAEGEREGMACLASLRDKLGPAEFARRLEDPDPKFDSLRATVARIECWQAHGMPPRTED